MSSIDALRALTTYFADASHHLDTDIKHVSQQEFASARGKLSTEVDALLDTLDGYPDAYTTLASVESEGFFNDAQVSLRDMYVALRGTSYKGTPLGAMKDSLEEALSRPFVRRKNGTYPTEMIAKENVMSFGLSFILSGDEGSDEGSIDERVLAVGNTFSLKDHHGDVVATGKEHPFSWGTQVDVFDGSGKKIGTLKEEVWSSLLSWQTHYQILDANGAVVAESAKEDWLTTHIEMTGRDGKRLLTLDRPAFTLTGDRWSVHFDDQTMVDPRIGLLAAAFKSAADRHRELSKKSN